ncbi:MAG: hypothetical protein B7Z02_09535 [Rhodobacterales bacterium 32-67-9]|nr:MAG: hypothetical protein B7Z02_09535 [Rhodobacterales bacterium 32-67-9]
MKLDKSQKHFKLRLGLAKLRPMTSLIDREIIAGSDAIVPHNENWVKMYLDQGHRVSFDGGRVIALRGMDFRGRPMWFVRREDHRYGYHSLESDPLAATEEAQAAWSLRRAVRQNWDEVERTASRLIARQEKFSVTLDDARNSALCTAGIEGFLEQTGLTGITGIPGWLAAILMRTVDQQVGFVIYAAAERVRRKSDDEFALPPLA